MVTRKNHVNSFNKKYIIFNKKMLFFITYNIYRKSCGLRKKWKIKEKHGSFVIKEIFQKL